MIGTRTLARTLLAGIFVSGGVNQLRKAKVLAPIAKNVTGPISDAVGVDSERLVQVNGAVQVVSGAALALGIAPRAAALALGASVIPTTFAGHRFWEISEPEKKQQEFISFLKNASILGGLIFAALDTGGRPSVFWAGRRAASGAIHSISSGVNSAYDTVTP